MPAPFSRSMFAYGEPVEVDGTAGEEVMEEKRAELEKSLTDLTDYVDNPDSYKR